jgi:hypothetical protein
MKRRLNLKKWVVVVKLIHGFSKNKVLSDSVVMPLVGRLLIAHATPDPLVHLPCPILTRSKRKGVRLDTYGVAPLTDDDPARLNLLVAVDLHSQTLSARIATVLGRAGSLLVCALDGEPSHTRCNRGGRGGRHAGARERAHGGRKRHALGEESSHC